MNDKQMLELAAKAAGYDYFSNTDGSFIRSSRSGRWIKWNPLTDDGDALRLAVKLDLHIRFFRKHIDVSMDVHELGFICHHFTTNKEEATRRAITRAAAEIGRAL